MPLYITKRDENICPQGIDAQMFITELFMILKKTNNPVSIN
jgi:hypothetical protein